MTDLKCPSCGSPNVEYIDWDKCQCPYCGKSFTISEASISQQSLSNKVPDFTTNAADNQVPEFSTTAIDEPGCLMNALCFLFPIVGLLGYFVKRDTEPNSAKSYLIWGIVGFVVWILLNSSGFWDGFWAGFYGY